MPESCGAEDGFSGGYVCSNEVLRWENAFLCVLQLRFRMASLVFYTMRKERENAVNL